MNEELIPEVTSGNYASGSEQKIKTEKRAMLARIIFEKPDVSVLERTASLKHIGVSLPEMLESATITLELPETATGT